MDWDMDFSLLSFLAPILAVVAGGLIVLALECWFNRSKP
jgi:hypothetical protein